MGRVNEGLIFSVIASRQEGGSFVCKHRRIEEPKMKANIFVYKIFTNSLFKATQPLQRDAVPRQSEAITKWSHRKVSLLFLILKSLVINTIKASCSDLYWQYCPWSLHRPHKLSRCLELGNISQYRSKKQSLLYCYETYLQVAKALLNTCKEKLQKLTKTKVHKDSNRWLVFRQVRK